MNLPLLATIGIALALFLWVARAKPAPLQGEVKRRIVACKKCRAQIGVNNTKVDQEFSLKCETCKTRIIYKAVDLVSR